MPEFEGGVCFPQTYCIRPRHDAEVQFTDDAIFSGKKAIFQLVALLNTLDEMESVSKEMADIATDDYLISLDEVTFFVPRVSCERIPAGRLEAINRPLFRTATSDEFSQSSLCNSRPDPRGYNENLIWDSMGGNRYVVIRFDRFVFATCKSKTELEQILMKLNSSFH